MVATVLGPVGSPAKERIAGLTTMMYAIVTKVVTPPRTSVRARGSALLDAEDVAGHGRGWYPAAVYFLRRVMPPLRVWMETLAPPPPVENSSSFSVVKSPTRLAGGPNAFSTPPLNVEIEKSAATSAGSAR